MQLPQYITTTEVQRVCRELCLRDWTESKVPAVLPEEAARIRAELGGEALLVSEEAFRQGLEVELEHGTRFPDTNVTYNHPLLTGRIVAAHLKESLDYYHRLAVAELEGDLLKTMRAGDFQKASIKYKLLVEARLKLAQVEAGQLVG